MTDFENAAFAVFIVLLSRAIMNMNVNFYIPISKVRHKPHPFVITNKTMNLTPGFGFIGRREHAPRAAA
jgi:Glutamate-cysteine ligase